MSAAAAAARNRKLFLADHVVVAPMVRGSERAFRMWLRSLYGANGLTCYTPMLRADALVKRNDNDDARGAPRSRRK